jgi:dephospho-CoA kinase
MIVAIAGTYSAGKDIGAQYLAERFGLLHVSTGDMVRALTEQLHDNIKRETQIKTANTLRDERGAAFLVELALSEYEDKQGEFNGIIVSGVRSIGEAEEVLRQGGQLIFVDAPADVRWQRSTQHKRGGDEQTQAQFEANEQGELHGDGNDKTVINLLAVKGLSDIEITNADSLGQYFADLEQYIQTVA